MQSSGFQNLQISVLQILKGFYFFIIFSFFFLFVKHLTCLMNEQIRKLLKVKELDET